MTISYIPGGIPFLETLAEYLLQETDPLWLPSCQIFLPTQKACEGLKAALFSQKGHAILLPKTQSLGHLNAEDLFLQGGSDNLLKARVSDRRRHLLLTNLVSVHHHLNTEQAASLATTLITLLDDLARADIALDQVDFDQLVSADHALHWQVTGDFLKLIQHEWPKVLAAEDTLEPYALENVLLDTQARLWAENSPQHPVIIAGSRGSRPATARLIQQVTALPQGQIILQGLMPSDCLEDLAPTHPQADLQKLLKALGCGPLAIRALKPANQHPSRILESAFQYGPAPMESIRGISLAECTSSQQEADVIALALRQVLETPDKTGLLITQDTNLARRVRMALQRWNIQIPGNIPLSQTSFGSLMALTAQWIQPDFDLGIFLATLKHPLLHNLSSGLQTKGNTEENPCYCVPKDSTKPPSFLRKQEPSSLSDVAFGEVAPHNLLGRDVEKDREYYGKDFPVNKAWVPASAGMTPWEEISSHGQACSNPELRLHKHLINQLELEIIRKGSWSWELILQKSKSTTLEPFVQELGNLIQACQELARANHVSFDKVMTQHQQLLEYLLETDLWPVADYAAEVQTFWADLHKDSHGLTISTGAEYGKLLAKYLEDASCKGNYTHDRIRILGLMEARLLHADTIILGGLNQGSWPQNLPVDPWFNRVTRQKLGLPAPEERIGLSAHDFVQAGAAAEILLTRSVRVDGTPTVPSTFLVQLQTWLHQQGQTLPVAQHLLDWSMPLLETRTPITAPAPKPPIDVRPRTLSITDMATWVQNPYGIYAKHVLGLRPLPSPFEHNTGLVFGTMVHLVLQKLVEDKPSNLWDMVENTWHLFAGQFLPHEQVFWHWRMQQMVKWFVHLPENMQPYTSYAEAKGKIKIGDFTIVGKIDRIDIRTGQAYVIDYKTGVLPSTGFVKYGISPQLLLEAWMVQDGIMEQISPTPVTSASLWRLPTGWQNDTRITLDGNTLDISLTQLKEKVDRLITQFKNPDTPYLCHPRGKIYGSPYDHLARVQEWATQDHHE